jgi:RHS repeat-associated protein
MEIGGHFPYFSFLEMKHLSPLSSVLEALSYGYDASGNRTSMNRQSVALPLPNGASNINYNEANQMLTFQPETQSAKDMTYDENGNLLTVTNTCGTTNYTWDARNRLIGISGFTNDCSPFTANFKYDALGSRTEKTVNGRSIQYFYDGLDIVQEIENSAVSANYIRTLNIDEPLAKIKADGTVRYYQTDALGSIVALTDETGTVKTTYSYDPFGAATISGEASDNPFQYTGRENDNTGLYYYRARYYSPELQRFISEDPILKYGNPNIPFLLPALLLTPQALNSYEYVWNSPVNNTDPEGLEPGYPRWIPLYHQLKCLYEMYKCASNIEKLNEDCNRECEQGQHGGSMQKCAADKCFNRFKDCLYFGVPFSPVRLK